MDDRRIRKLFDAPFGEGPIIYWMSRDQRISDHWALFYAQQLAITQKKELFVVFCLVPMFLGATLRSYAFMLKGLREAEENCRQKNISFFLLMGKPEEKILHFVKEKNSSCLVTDFNPLKISKKWKEKILQKISIPFHEVDAHNIVPCWIASSKQEFSAATFRPKIKKLLPEFLTKIPPIKKHPFMGNRKTQVDWDKAFAFLKAHQNILDGTFLPGEHAAKKMFREFLKKKLRFYEMKKNDPTEEGLSNLSPYLHFGQISAQKIAWEVHLIQSAGTQAFLEELIVRKELADNFCFYNEHYDSVEGFPNWAKKTLKEHTKDKRETIYSFSQFEKGETHDEIWNAAQKQMVQTGKLHGYLRMYWAKKILEWTRIPEEALKIAIDLNDKYELDGRDPNGYVGIAWALGGLHDRAFGERPIFGKIRWMSQEGLKKKFRVQKFLEMME